MYFATIHFKSTDLLANIAADQGQRAFIGKVNMNWNTPEGYGERTEDSYKMTEDFIIKLKNQKVRLFLLHSEQLW
jgi:guanine deaminase